MPLSPKEILELREKHGLECLISERELHILELICLGLTNKEIAKELVLSPETIKSHVRNLLGKLQARNRAHLVFVGITKGYIIIEEELNEVVDELPEDVRDFFLNREYRASWK